MRKSSIAQVGSMQCIARPSATLRTRLNVMYPERGQPVSGGFVGVLEDIVKVDAFSALLSEAWTKGFGEEQTAIYVLRKMMTDGGAQRPRLSLARGQITKKEADNVEAMAVDMMAARALGRLIWRGIEQTQERDGKTDPKKVAVYVLRAMKEAKL